MRTPRGRRAAAEGTPPEPAAAVAPAEAEWSAMMASWPPDIMELFFDPAWYMQAYPDVAISSMDPLEHFRSIGHLQDRNPHPLIDGAWYLRANPDVARAGRRAFQHLMHAGAREARAPCTMFDARWYLRRNPDVVASGMSALEHYLRKGLREGRDPHPLFRAGWYLARNPDVARAGMAAVHHFILAGQAEGRDPHPLFDTRHYLARHPDTADSSLPAFSHFLERGMPDNRSPHILFDPDWYLARYPEASAAGLGAFGHFLNSGLDEGHDPGPLFDSAWYRRRHGVTARPLEHFLAEGLERGLDPCPFFDGAWYARQNPEVARAGIAPFQHFLQTGLAAGRAPHPLFLADWYAADTPGLGDEPACLHFLRHGMAAGRAPSPLFDAAWYLARTPDAAASGPPLTHFLQHGMAAGSSPHPLFDSDWYAARNPDRQEGESPFAHFLRIGLHAQRDPHPLFDSAWYAGVNPDYLQSGLPPFLHYLVHGVNQGRDPSPLFQSGYFTGGKPRPRHPLAEYVAAGKRFTANPAPFFDHRWYVAQYGDSFADDVSPLAHYVANPHLRPHPLFDPDHLAAALGETGGTDDPLAPVRLRRQEAAAGPACILTVVTRADLPAAKLLAESIKRHDRHIRFCVALCDTAIGVTLEDCPHFDEVVTASHMLGEAFQPWAFTHEAEQACRALRPAAMRWLLDHTGCDRLVCLDASMLCFAPLAPVLAALDTAPALLAPRHLEPGASDASQSLCAPGFVALRRDPVALRFLDWWQQGLAEAGGRMLDQAPILFPELALLRDPGCNVTAANAAARRLAGDLTHGFTAAGERLAFFDFNDTAQSDNAAVALLRTQRAIRLAIATTVEPAPSAWGFAHFIDGQCIEPTHRALYRASPELRRRFPHPFTAETSPRRSLRARFVELGALQPRALAEDAAGGSAAATPLARWLERAKAGPAGPTSPWFDPDYYLATQPGLAGSGADPARHFLELGLQAGARPCAGLDIAFYRLQTGHASNAEAFASLLAHGPIADTRLTRAFDPELDAAACAALRQVLLPDRPTILLLGPAEDGDIAAHIAGLVAHFGDRANFLHLAACGPGLVKLAPGIQPAPFLCFDAHAQRTALAAMLRALGVTRAHVHQIGGMERLAPELLRQLAVPHDLTLHDFHLLTDEAAWLLRAARRIVAPSAFIAARYRARHPDLACTISRPIEPHLDGLPLPRPRLAEAGRLVIALPEHLTPHSGLDLVARVGFRIARENLPFRLVLLGASTDDELLLQSGIEVTGPVVPAELPRRLRGCRAGLLWFPAPQADSYSAAQPLALQSGLAVAAHAVGSLGERLAGIAQASLLPAGSGVPSWIALFQRLRGLIGAGLFARDMPPAEAPAFYRNAYLPRPSATAMAEPEVLAVGD